VAKWQTRSTQNAFPKGVRVQVPPSAQIEKDPSSTGVFFFAFIGSGNPVRRH